MKNFNQTFLALLAFALLIWILSKAGIIVIYLIMAAVLAYLLNPLVDFLEKAKINRAVSIFIVFLEVILVLGIVFFIFVPPLVSELRTAANVLPRQLETYKMQFHNWLVRNQQNYYLSQVLNYFEDFWRTPGGAESWLAGSQKLAISLISSIFHFFFSLIVTLVITFYLLLESKKLKSWFLAWLPEQNRFEVSGILIRINEKIARYVQTQFLICLMVAAWNVVVLLILGVDYAFVVGLIAGLASIVPVLGSIFGVSANMFFGVMSSFWKAVAATGAYLFIQFLSDHVISPQLIGQRTELHPLLVLLGVLVGAELFGPVGIIIAVPIMIILKEIIMYIDKRELEPS